MRILLFTLSLWHISSFSSIRYAMHVFQFRITNSRLPFTTPSTSSLSTQGCCYSKAIAYEIQKLSTYNKYICRRLVFIVFSFYTYNMIVLFRNLNFVHFFSYFSWNFFEVFSLFVLTLYNVRIGLYYLYNIYTYHYVSIWVGTYE